jgi:hypothetical protein
MSRFLRTDSPLAASVPSQPAMPYFIQKHLPEGSLSFQNAQKQPYPLFPATFSIQFSPTDSSLTSAPSASAPLVNQHSLQSPTPTAVSRNAQHPR